MTETESEELRMLQYLIDYAPAELLYRSKIAHRYLDLQGQRISENMDTMAKNTAEQISEQIDRDIMKSLFTNHSEEIVNLA